MTSGKTTLLILLSAVVATKGFAQQQQQEERQKRQEKPQFDVSGYVQTQWQLTTDTREWPDSYVSIGGDRFNIGSDNRFSVRRGFLRFGYTNGPARIVVQPGFSEKGLAVEDAWAGVTSNDGVWGLRVGLFKNPFGYESSASSATRPSAERSRTFNALFPSHCVVGAAATITGSHGLSLEAAVVNGGEAVPETDSYKDLLAKLGWRRKGGHGEYGAALSYYMGTTYSTQPTHYVYHWRETTGSDGGFERIETSAKLHRRHYVALSATASRNWSIGRTQLTTEWVVGRQPSGAERFANISGINFNLRDNIYIRDFYGGYVTLMQQIGRTRHSVVLKFDRFDPNRRVSGDAIGRWTNGLSAATDADLAYTTLSIGYLYDLNDCVRLMAWYDMARNELSRNLAGFTPADRVRQNLLTLRLQVRMP